MAVDIDRLSEDELRDLHYKVTERLRVIQQLRAHKAMMEFSIGDRVAFHADGRRVTGVLTKYNRKTVTVLADGGTHWNVSPGLLDRAGDAVPEAPATRDLAGLPAGHGTNRQEN